MVYVFISLFYAPILTFALVVRHVSHLDTCLRIRRNLPFCRTKAYLSQLDRCLMPRAPLYHPCFGPIISRFCALFAPKFRHNFCPNCFNTNGSLDFISCEWLLRAGCEKCAEGIAGYGETQREVRCRKKHWKELKRSYNALIIFLFRVNGRLGSIVQCWGWSELNVECGVLSLEERARLWLNNK